MALEAKKLTWRTIWKRDQKSRGMNLELYWWENKEKIIEVLIIKWVLKSLGIRLGLLRN